MQASDKSLFALIETSKANDTAVAMSLATMSDDPRPDEDKRFALAVAIVLVKAAGYRIVRPRKPKNFKRGKTRVGPSFIAEFADGTTTRMSTYTSLENLDWDRGVRLSQAAWGSRWRAKHFKQTGRYPVDAIAPVPPAIVSAFFEQDGVVLAQRNNESVP
jgi:hypothetical protein